MAHIHGKNAAVYVNENDISGDRNSATIDISVDTGETTSFQENWDTFVEGNAVNNISLDGFYEPGAGSIDAITDGLIGSSSALIGVYPQGVTAGNVGYEEKGVMTGKTPTIPVGEAVTMGLEFQGTGRLARNTVLQNATVNTSTQTSAQNFGAAGSEQVTGVVRITGYTGLASGVNVAIQESADNGVSDAFTSIITFSTATGTASQRLQSATPGEQYLRVDVAAVSAAEWGSVTLMVSAENK